MTYLLHTAGMPDWVGPGGATPVLVVDAVDAVVVLVEVGLSLVVLVMGKSSTSMSGEKMQ